MTDKPADASKTSKASLAPAAESGDPAVHHLLAVRQAHVSNLAAATASDETAKEKADTAKAAIADVDKQLAELGVTAQ